MNAGKRVNTIIWELPNGKSKPVHRLTHKQLRGALQDVEREASRYVKSSLAWLVADRERRQRLVTQGLHMLRKNAAYAQLLDEAERRNLKWTPTI